MQLTFMEAVASLTTGFQRNCHQFGVLGEDHLVLPENLQRRSPHCPPWATHVTAMQALLTVCLQVGNGNFHPIFQRLPRRLDYGTCHLLPPGWYTRNILLSLAGDVAGCSALVIPLPQLDRKLLPAGTRASPSFISYVFTPSRVSIWPATSGK